MASPRLEETFHDSKGEIPLGELKVILRRVLPCGSIEPDSKGEIPLGELKVLAVMVHLTAQTFDSKREIPLGELKVF